MPTVKIFCHSCGGIGFIWEDGYPTGDIVKVLCPECDGVGFTEVESVSFETDMKYPQLKQGAVIFTKAGNNRYRSV